MALSRLLRPHDRLRRPNAQTWLKVVGVAVLLLVALFALSSLWILMNN